MTTDDIPRTITITKTEVENYYKSLGRIRSWMQGFKAAGGTPPHDEDQLRSLQLMLKNAK